MKYLTIFLEVFDFIYTDNFKNFVFFAEGEKYFLPAEARAEGEGAAKNEANRLWWCLLDKVRTYYEQNPDTG